MIKIQSILSIVTFLGVILVVNVKYLTTSEESENIENRTLAECPEFNILRLDPFPNKFEKFYNDHFSYKYELLKWNKLLKLDVFKESPHKSVIIGKDGFLFADK